MRKAALDVLKGLHEKHGVLRSEDVVREARSPRSPLHRAFQWDNAKAAHAFRLHQARQLIAVAVTMLGDGEPIRIFAHVRSAGPGYHRLDHIATTASLRQAYLQQLRDDVAALNQKYETYADALKRPAIGATIKALQELLSDEEAAAA